MNADLRGFVRDALARGIPRDDVRRALLEARWRADEVDAALAEWVDGGIAVPVPRRKAQSSAREAFLHLLLHATLYTAAFDTGAIAFALIEHWLPDRAMGPLGFDPRLEGLRWAVAGLLIALPVFLYTSRLISTAMAREPEQRGSGVRRWLTYLTLFVAALVLIGDFVAVLRGLLSGELVPRFLLKAAVVAGIAGIIFRHYLADLRREETETPGVARGGWLARLGVGAMVLAAIAGLVTIGTPSRARMRQGDLVRVESLQRLSQALDGFHAREGRWPATLADLARADVAGIGPADLRDPLTHLPYGYSVVDSSHVQLCADFAAADSLGPGGAVSVFWAHPAGRRCFVFTAPRTVPVPQR